MGSSRAQGKMTIESNFARTCNRFSQFLRQRRSFGDIDAFTSIASPNFETQGDRDGYLARIQTESDDSNPEMKVNKPLDLFPMTSMDNSRKSSKSKEEPKQNTKANMTIIYDGKVILLEDLQEEKAEEIMSLASQGGGITEKYDALPNKNNTIITTSPLNQIGLSYLPIARRASLHRFMDKRKDMIGAFAPYQLKNSTSTKELYKQQEEHRLALKLW